MDIPIFRIGGLVRIDHVDPNDNHGLRVGQVVTITAAKVDPAGRSYFVVSAGGKSVAVYREHTSPVAVHDELHPEDTMPDDARDAKFDEMVDLYAHEFYGKSFDEVVATLADVEDNRPTTDPKLPPVQVDGGVAVRDVTPPSAKDAKRYKPDALEDAFSVTDPDGVPLSFVYNQTEAPNGEIVGTLRIFVAGRYLADLPVAILPMLVQFFGTRTAKLMKAREDKRGRGTQS